jgi:hypothetical protein
MTRSGLQQRLKALEAKTPDPTEPQKALFPAWLIEEIEKQSVRLDASGLPREGRNGTRLRTSRLGGIQRAELDKS